MKAILPNSNMTCVSGKLGALVYTRRKNGVFARAYAKPHNPQSGPQQANRARMNAVTNSWRLLSAEQVSAWSQYALSHPKRNDVSGDEYVPSAFNAYASLALRWLAANGTGTPPQWPPQEEFMGDDITIMPVGAMCAIAWVVSAANAPGVVTALKVQPLLRVNSKPNPNKYRTVEITKFQSAGETVTTTLAGGLYAAACEFLSQDTGQAAGLVELGKVWAIG